MIEERTTRDVVPAPRETESVQPRFPVPHGIPERGRYDVIVVGAGPAGLGAAVAAARLGSRTLIIERYGFPGGMGTIASAAFLMGFAADGRQVVGGVADELVRRLDAMGEAHFREWPTNTPDPRSIGRRPLLADVMTSVEALRVCYNRMLADANVKRLYYTSFLGAMVEDGKITAIAIDNADGLGLLRAKAFVDATGDANVVWRAGGPAREAPVDQAMTKTILFTLGGVEDFVTENVVKRYKELHAAGKSPLPEQDVFMGLPTVTPKGAQINFTMTGGNALDAKDLTRMDVELREQVLTAVEWFKDHFAEFRNAYLLYTSPGVGVRAGRGIVGLDTITVQDIDDAVKTPNPVALCRRSWGGHGLRSFHDGGVKDYPGTYGIPLGALVPQGLANVTVGGRAISAEPLAVSCCRLMATCIATGQASGTLAALSLRENLSVPIVPYSVLRKARLEQGATLE